MNLVRGISTPDGTTGTWFNDDGSVLCHTIELPWNDNLPDKSCIPTGRYQFCKYTSPKHGSVWMARKVPGRTSIEIHPANFATELLGCIGVGDRVGVCGKLPAVMNSQKTFAMLKSVLPDSFFLTIT